MFSSLFKPFLKSTESPVVPMEKKEIQKGKIQTFSVRPSEHDYSYEILGPQSSYAPKNIHDQPTFLEILSELNEEEQIQSLLVRGCRIFEGRVSSSRSFNYF